MNADPIGVVLGRFAETITQLDDFYSAKEAVAWCESPQVTLGGKRPLELLLTKSGTEQVVAVIARLRDGAFV